MRTTVELVGALQFARGLRNSSIRAVRCRSARPRSLHRNDVAGFASVTLPHHTNLLYQLMDGYKSSDVALNVGLMLRECIKLPHLHALLLYGPVSVRGTARASCTCASNRLTIPRVAAPSL